MTGCGTAKPGEPWPGHQVRRAPHLKGATRRSKGEKRATTVGLGQPAPEAIWLSS